MLWYHCGGVGHDLFENLHVLSMGIQLAAVWGLLGIIENLEKRLQNQTKSLPDI